MGLPTQGEYMVINRDREFILHQITVLQNYIDDKYESLTVKQISSISDGIESLWSVVCRRKGR